MLMRVGSTVGERESNTPNDKNDWASACVSQRVTNHLQCPTVNLCLTRWWKPSPSSVMPSPPTNTHGLSSRVPYRIETLCPMVFTVDNSDQAIRKDICMLSTLLEKLTFAETGENNGGQTRRDHLHLWQHIAFLLAAGYENDAEGNCCVAVTGRIVSNGIQVETIINARNSHRRDVNNRANPMDWYYEITTVKPHDSQKNFDLLRRPPIYRE
jgi:hypothetical protein